MKVFEPSADFVSRVMRSAHAYEASRRKSTELRECLLASKPLRYAMSWWGVLFGIVLSPAACL